MTLEPSCIVCNCNAEQVPLLTIQYRSQTYWICPQHLPILIHKPEQLADKLPGAGHLPSSAESHH